MRKLLIILGVLIGVAILSTIIATHLVSEASDGLVYSNLASVPHSQVAVVLGCSPTARSGRANLFFRNRVQAAAELVHAGKADYLLVSGDNHTKDYDEPTAMRGELVKLGVPADRIVLDYAGFSTLDTIVRAKKVFGLQ